MARTREEIGNSIKLLVSNAPDRNSCILYPVVNKDGYGEIQHNVEGRKKHILAHRIAYEVHNDVKLTSEQILLHSCDVRNCINPAHLRIGTHADNVQDKVSKGRQAKGIGSGSYTTGYYSKFDHVERPKPEFTALFNRKLSKEKVEELKLAIANKGNKTLKKLSEEIGVSYHTLKDLKCGRTYTD